MRSLLRVFKRGDTWAVGFLILWPLVYFWPVTLAQGVWFTRDIARLYYPFALEFSRALSSGQLPLWTTNIQSGFPLLAEGHVAAFYPLNALMLKFLPPDFSLSYEMLLHLVWMGCGMYACARSMGLRVASALLVGFAFSFNGFAIQKIYHTPILVTAAWLPWLVFFLDRFQRARHLAKPSAALWLLFATLATGIQYLEGFPQIAFLNSVTFGLVGLFGEIFWNGSGAPRRDWRGLVPAALWTALPVMLGVGVAAIQLVPTAELIGYSTRVGSTIDAGFRTSYSMPPEFLTQFVYPFGQGEPTDDNNEYWGYLGWMVLALAVSALWLRREARTFFFAGFALVCLSLTLGSVNPLYHLLEQLPIFSFFRVPARYLLPFGFAATILAGIGFEEFLRRASVALTRRAIAVGAAFALVTGGTIWLAYTQSLDFWLNAWQVLPWLLGAAVILILALAWKSRLDRGMLGAGIIGLTIFDLAAYAPPFLLTIDAISPHSYVEQPPRSLPALGTTPTLDRVFTDESIWPSPQAQRASLFPNYNILYNKESAHAYSPLVFGASEAYLVNLSPAMLNLMNVRYFLIPLEPRRTDIPPTPYPTLSLDVVDNQEEIPPTPASEIEVTSFAENTAQLEGQEAAELIVTSDTGQTRTFPLRIGIETADWDYGRESGTFAPPTQSSVAHPIAAFWRSLGRPFEGYVYQARFQLAAPGQDWNVVGAMVRPAIDKSHLSIESISLIDHTGHSSSLAALAGKDDFSIKYMSDTAAAWENLDLLPRAFLVHRAQVMPGDDVFDKMRQLGFRPDQEVLLTDGAPMTPPNSFDSTQDKVEIVEYQPEEVSISVSTASSGYLVLDDSWYPGWNALVDGKPAPIYQADFIYRAVPISPGEHTVVFVFRPLSLVLGLCITLLSLLTAGVVSLLLRRQYHHQRETYAQR